MLPWSLAILILLVDQWTKAWIRLHFSYSESRAVIDGFFNLVYVRNDGAAWNLLSGQSWLLITISLTVLLLLAIKGRTELMCTRFTQIIYGLLLGGIAGNLADRVRFGWVTDFLDFQFGSYHYPSFNIADAAICVGAILYIWSQRAKISPSEASDA
ncbi:MAG: signal peptidase II [Pontiellaceae bacterium]|nr:signal peptidase II [Kiritimatiellaceae bacterium]HBO87652.1 signal peptidase II [Verrucomicrobiota bacterium]|tara:strand:+ start:481 stop:948 length:468 start_codon:yes stop_codon:yes gene_type:complete